MVQSTLQHEGVAVNALFLDQDLGLLQAVEYFVVEQLVAEPGIESFAASIFPSTNWIDMDRFEMLPKLLPLAQ